MLIPRRTVRTRQPQFPVPASQSFSPSHLWLPNSGMAAEVVKGRHAKYRAANTTFGVNSEGRGVDHSLGPYSKGLYSDAFTGDKWAGAGEITVFAVASLTQQPPESSWAHLLRIDANSDPNSALLDLAIRFVSASGQLQMEGLLATNGASGWTGSVFTDVMGASAFVIGEPYLFMFRYRSGQFLQYSLSKIGGPVAWVSSSYVPSGSVIGPSTPMEAHIGGLSYPSESNFPGTINLVGILPYSIPDSYARQLAANPWQIFEDEEDYVFVPAAGGGSTLNASASGGDVASGSADLSAQVALASVGVSTASGAATLAASVPLSAVGLAVAAGSATPSATVTISAAGLAQAAGQAGLSASVLAQAAGAAEASGNAELAAQLDALATGAAQAGGSANLSGGAAGSLSASGAAIAAGTAVLSVTVGLQAAGSALASGTATGSANAPGQVSATGGATAGGSGVMSARVSITAAGFVQAMGQGAFSATVPLSAFGAVTASGYAYLTVDNGVVMVRAPSGYRSSLIAYNSMRPRQSITIRPISLNTRR